MAPAVRDAFYEATLLTLAQVADTGKKGAGKPPDVEPILTNVQKVQDAQSPGDTAPRTVCSTR
jgi:alpha-glucoside transport system substrate-binding protein